MINDKAVPSQQLAIPLWSVILMAPRFQVPEGGYILSSLRKERLGEKGGAFLNGKEGWDDFRKNGRRSARCLFY